MGCQRRSGLHTCALLLCCLVGLGQSLVIETAHREVNLSSQRVIERTKLIFKNDGKTSVGTITLCLHASTYEHLAVLDAVQGGPDDMQKMQMTVPWGPFKGAPEGTACAEYTLAEELPKGEVTEIAMMAVSAGLIHPRPATMKQGDPHRVEYIGNAHVLSPYKILSETVDVVVDKVISHKAPSPSDKGEKEISLGPYSGLSPFSLSPLEIHYETLFPFVHATKVIRKIDVSHWTGVHIEETYDLVNKGAKIVGEWSRLVSMTNEEASRGAISHMPAVLPQGAFNIFFYDDIGNISTSKVVTSQDKMAVLLEPRFPLFGGWRAVFKFGYTLPVQGSIYSRENREEYVLASALAPSIKELVTDDLEVHILLPEGASHVKVIAGLKFERRDEKQYTYLDVLGRPVVVLRLKNVVPEANSVVQVSYTYASWMKLQKLVIGGGLLMVLLLSLSIVSVMGSSEGASGAAAAKLKAQ